MGGGEGEKHSLQHAFCTYVLRMLRTRVSKSALLACVLHSVTIRDDITVSVLEPVSSFPQNKGLKFEVPIQGFA